MTSCDDPAGVLLSRCSLAAEVLEKCSSFVPPVADSDDDDSLPPPSGTRWGRFLDLTGSMDF